MPDQSSPVTSGFRAAPSVPPARIVLIHGAAVTARVWDGVVARLPREARPAVPERRCTGALDEEIAALAPLCADAVVVGVSGGATLGLELAARGVTFRAALLHEPAVGSLRPGLLAPMVAAYRDGGVPGFARTLYGPRWTPDLGPADPDAVARDLAMFGAFEPSPAATGSGRVVVTVGEASPPVRHEAAEALRTAFGYEVRVLPGSGHAAHLEAPDALAELITSLGRRR